MPRQPVGRALAARRPQGRSQRRAIVCAVAGVEEAERPTAVARELAERLVDELVLVHCAAPPPLPGDGGLPAGSSRTPERAHLREAASSVLRTIAERLDLGAARRRALVGDPATAVAEVAEELDADLIVVGSPRDGSFAGSLVGSVSREIVAATDRPVVVVSSAGGLPHLTPVRYVVCGVNGGPASPHAVRVATDLAARLQVGLVFVDVQASPPLRREAGLLVVSRHSGLLTHIFRAGVPEAAPADACPIVVLA